MTHYKGDVLDTPTYKALVEKHDVIIHLAAIVGYPACKKGKKTEPFGIIRN